MQKRTTNTSPPASGVYLFTGEDDFRKELSLGRFKEKFLSGKAGAFNYESFQGRENSAEEVIRSLETFPLGTDKKLVVLKEPELLSKDDKGVLASYIKGRKAGRSALVLLAGRSGSRDDKFINTLSKSSKVIDFSGLEPDEISAWIVKEFKARGKTINYRTAKLVCGSSGEGLGRISTTIEQIALFLGERDKVTEDDISHFVQENTSEQSAFKFLDYINDRDTSRSLQVLKDLILSGSTPYKIVGLLSWHITRLISVKRLLEKGISRSNMLSYFNIGTYTLNRLISQAESFSLRQLKNQLEALLDTDLKLKRSSLKGEFLLEMLVVKWGRP